MPDFKKTEVDSKQISGAHADIDDSISELLAICTTLQNRVMPDLNRYWQGPAQQRFQARFHAFTAGLSELAGSYRELNDQLTKAGTTYGKADDSVVKLVAQLPR